jgi:hypothetical protein
MVFNPGTDMARLRYTVQSEEVNSQRADILDYEAQGSITQYATPPTGPDAQELTNIADRETRNAQTPLQEADRLESWFQSSHFTYSLKPDLPQTNWLLPFLTNIRAGYCVQYAQAFAILARALGIPARIAIGYTAGTPGPDRTWDVTTADAHAWPELYFVGYGWLRFEPTPSGRHGQGTAEVPVYGGSGQAGSASSNSAVNPHGPNLGDIAGAGGPRTKQGFNKDVHLAGGGGPRPTNRASSGMGLTIAIPIVLFLLITWPALTRLLTRRRRWLSAASGDAAAAHAAWRELTDDLADYGLGCEAGETPRAVARRVTMQARLDETATRAVGRLAAAEERAQYARTPESGAGLKAAEVTVRRAIAASVPRRQRLRARLVPASTVLAARHLLQRGNEMLSWLDSSWPTLRRQLRWPAAHRAG